jgi:hypothetical protein
MAAATNMRPSWPFLPPVGHDADQPDHVPPDQGPAQAVIDEMAASPRDARGRMRLGGIVLGAITVG